MTRKKPKPPRFKTIVNEFFKRHGVKSPSKYLALRGGISRAHVYNLYRAADRKIGMDSNELDPKIACWLIQQAEDVVGTEEIFRPTPIEVYLRPGLEKFYQEQMKND